MCAWGCGSKSTNWRSQNRASHINRSNQARFKGQINKKSWKHQKKSQSHKFFPFLFCKLIWSKHFDFQLPLATKRWHGGLRISLWTTGAFQRQKMARGNAVFREAQVAGQCQPIASNKRSSWVVMIVFPFHLKYFETVSNFRLSKKAVTSRYWPGGYYLSKQCRISDLMCYHCFGPIWVSRCFSARNPNFCLTMVPRSTESTLLRSHQHAELSRQIHQIHCHLRLRSTAIL